MSFEATFTPNKENEQLPLSNKYRDSLRSLCVILKEGGKLSAEYESKREILHNMCKKLEKDDQNVKLSQMEGKFTDWAFKTVATSTALGSAYLLWRNWNSVDRLFSKILKKQPPVANIEQVRNARLQALSMTTDK